MQHWGHSGDRIFENEFIRQGILFGNEFERGLASPRESAMDVSETLREALEITGLKQADFAKKVGVAQGTISKWISGGQVPNKAQWDVVTEFLAKNIRTRHLVDGGSKNSNVVRVMGRIGAGAEISPDEEQVPPEGLSEIEVPFPLPDNAIAFQVEGDSMWPRYDPGDVIVCLNRERDPADLVGWEAAVRTTKGQRYLKRLRNGARKGLYDLESHNGEPIRGVRLAWASEVHSVVRAGQWRALSERGRNRLVHALARK
jgi:phage repressor protein C with HTH and peptisase S24 domain